MPRFSRGLAAALLLGAIVRWLPLEEWSRRPCVRDECTYRAMATNLLRGEGMVGNDGEGACEASRKPVERPHVQGGHL